jgi:MinD-like ATPase involved in chromosome partitioning or flagellar assembly
MERPNVLLALPDGELVAAEAALRRAGFEPIRLNESGPAVELAVIDCDEQPEMARQLHDSLHDGRSVPTILLFGAEPPDYGTRSDEYAMKPCPPDSLVYRLQALMIRTGLSLPGDVAGMNPELGDVPMMGEGRVISIFAPKGGVGKTTVAVNMAVALREQTRDRVLLFDADVGVGNVTSVLEVPAKKGLVDLADSPPSEWTDLAFEHITAEHAATGVRVLTWGSDPADSEKVTVDLLLAALRWGKAHHAYVVVDNHPGYDDRTMAMLTLATEIFLVVTPEVGAIRNSSQFLALAREVGLGDIIRVVVNRANHGIALEDMSRSLGLPVSATVVSNGPKAVVAANEGNPVILKFPKEKISLDLHNVARLVTQPPAPKAAVASRPWWMRLTARASNA